MSVDFGQYREAYYSSIGYTHWAELGRFVHESDAVAVAAAVQAEILRIKRGGDNFHHLETKSLTGNGIKDRPAFVYLAWEVLLLDFEDWLCNACNSNATRPEILLLFFHTFVPRFSSTLMHGSFSCKITQGWDMWARNER
jgi:hypothetical protein